MFACLHVCVFASSRLRMLPPQRVFVLARVRIYTRARCVRICARSASLFILGSALATLRLSILAPTPRARVCTVCIVCAGLTPRGSVSLRVSSSRARLASRYPLPRRAPASPFSRGAARDLARRCIFPPRASHARRAALMPARARRPGASALAVSRVRPFPVRPRRHVLSWRQRRASAAREASSCGSSRRLPAERRSVRLRSAPPGSVRLRALDPAARAVLASTGPAGLHHIVHQAHVARRCAWRAASAAPPRAPRHRLGAPVSSAALSHHAPRPPRPRGGPGAPRSVPISPGPFLRPHMYPPPPPKYNQHPGRRGGAGRAARPRRRGRAAAFGGAAPGAAPPRPLPRRRRASLRTAVSFLRRRGPRAPVLRRQHCGAASSAFPLRAARGPRPTPDSRLPTPDPRARSRKLPPHITPPPRPRLRAPTGSRARDRPHGELVGSRCPAPARFCRGRSGRRR